LVTRASPGQDCDEALGETPLISVVDDVRWIDQVSESMLTELLTNNTRISRNTVRHHPK